MIIIRLPARRYVKKYFRRQTSRVEEKNNTSTFVYGIQHKLLRNHHCILLSIECVQAVKAALESSSEEEFGGESPPPNKRRRFEGSTCSSLASPISRSFLLNQKGKMHTKRKPIGDSDLSDNGECMSQISQNGNHGGGVVVTSSSNGRKVAAIKERNRDNFYAVKKFTKFDEEIVRLIGQHLSKLGLR